MRIVVSCCLALLLGSLLAAQQTSPKTAWLDAQMPSLTNLYRHLHQNPELSFREVETARRIAKELRDAGFEVTEKVGGLGVVGVLKNGDGPRLLLRADLDALPVGEQTGLPYMSRLRTVSPTGEVAGVMHACGHDLHMTHLIGVARWLADHRDQWRGSVVCIGQPAEERSGGAQQMIDDGLFDRFGRPDHAIALHVDSSMPTGKVGLREGPSMANVESVDITIHGRGGHGAAPHTTIDPIAIAARLVLDLQTIVAREIDPTEPAVVTVGAIHGGQKHNIIDRTCHLQLTIRSYTQAVHDAVKQAIVRKANAQAASSGAPDPTIKFSEFTPALVNDAALTARCRTAFSQALGESNVLRSAQAMVAEDFSRFGEAGIPILMYRLGTIAPERLHRMQAAGEQPPTIHSAFYYPDFEPSLRTAVTATTAAISDLLAR
jgi:amidohydrolase